MFLYSAIIIICMLIITTINYLFVPIFVDVSFLLVFLVVFICVISMVIIDVILATIARWALPSKFFSVEKKWFSASKRECRFYEFIGIKKWKDKTLELGAVTGFRKNKLGDANNNEYVKRFILEANYGIMVHIFCIVFGFLLLFAMLIYNCFWVLLPVCVVNAILNAMSLFILRYNLPKLHTLYKYNERRIKRNQNLT